jgi:hypothetical protein
MFEMIWKEPPPLVSSEKAAALAELQKNPGRWALVQSRYKSTSGTTAWKKLGCEATHRRSDTATGNSPEYDIYARWPETKAAGSSKPLPLPVGKAAVEKAIITGTALKPPAPAIPKPDAVQPEPATPVASDPGLDKYLEKRRARVK